MNKRLTFSILLLCCLVFCLCACTQTPKTVSVAVQGEHCTITNAYRTVEQGSTVFFDLVFDQGYYYSGNNQGATYDETTGKLKVENVRVNTVVVLNVSAKVYAVTLLPSPGLELSGEQERTIFVPHGTTATFSVEFLPGYDFVSANVDCTYQNGAIKIENVTEELSLSIQTSYTSYVVQLADVEGLILLGASQIDVAKGQDAVFNVEIDQDYTYLNNNANALYDSERKTLTLKNVNQNTTINVSLQRKSYTVTLVGSHFECGQTTVDVLSGDDVSFDLQIESGYTYIRNDKGATYQNGKLTLHQVRGNEVVSVQTASVSSSPILTVSLVEANGFTIVGDSSKVVPYGSSVSFVVEIDSKFGYFGNDANATFDATTGTLTLNGVTSSQDISLNLRQGFFTVTVEEGLGFAVVGDRTVIVEENQTVSFNVQLLPGYVYLSNSANATYQNGVLTIQNVTSDVNVNIVVHRQVTVSVSDGNGFAVDQRVKTVSQGEDVSFQLTFDTGFAYATNDQGAIFDSYNNRLILRNVQDDVEIVIKVVQGNGTSQLYTNGTSFVSRDGEKTYFVASPNQGYEFCGWERAVEVDKWEIFSYANNLCLDVDVYGAELTLRPIFARQSQIFDAKGTTQTITYHANGGNVINSLDKTVTTHFTKATYLYSASLGSWCFDTFERDGYVPLEYNTKPDGTGQAISLGSRVLSDETHVDLYVIWAKETTASSFQTENVLDEEDNVVGVALVGYTGQDSLVVVPTKIDGVPVVAIKSGFISGNDTMQTFVITKNVEEVERGAFVNCSAFTTLYMCDSVLRIGDASFSNCANLSALRMIATWQPYYSDHLLGTPVRRVEKLFYLKNHSDKPTVATYGSSGMYHSIDGATLDQGLDYQYNIVNCGQNGNVSGQFAMSMIEPFLKEGDVLFFAPEWHHSLLGNRVNSVTWLTSEAYYDVWRYLDLRDYVGVFDGFQGMQLAGDGYNFPARNALRMQGKGLTYLDFVKTDKGEDQMDQYFTRAQVHDPAGAINAAVYYQIENVSIDSWANYFAQWFTNDIKVVWGVPAVYEEGIANEPSQIDAFYQELAEKLPDNVIIFSNWRENLYPYELLYDNTVHLTTEGAIINSQKIAQTLKSILNVYQ